MQYILQYTDGRNSEPLVARGVPCVFICHIMRHTWALTGTSLFLTLVLTAGALLLQLNSMTANRQAIGRCVIHNTCKHKYEQNRRHGSDECMHRSPARTPAQLYYCITATVLIVLLLYTSRQQHYCINSAIVRSVVRTNYAKQCAKNILCMLILILVHYVQVVK